MGSEIVSPEDREPKSDTSEFMRQVRIHTEHAVKDDEGSFPVRLRGGPMEGYLVYDDAPVLADDWHETWPRSVSSRYRPGHYVLLDEMERDARLAEWEEYT